MDILSKLGHLAMPINFFKCKNEYPVLPLKEETAVQAVVDSIVRAFQEMSARGYALHSVCPQHCFFYLGSFL